MKNKYDEQVETEAHFIESHCPDRYNILSNYRERTRTAIELNNRIIEENPEATSLNLSLLNELHIAVLYRDAYRAVALRSGITEESLKEFLETN